MFYRLLTFPPHPEERSEAERLEGWQREERLYRDYEGADAPCLLSPFETLRFAPFLRVR